MIFTPKLKKINLLPLFLYHCNRRYRRYRKYIEYIEDIEDIEDIEEIIKKKLADIIFLFNFCFFATGFSFVAFFTTCFCSV